MAFIQAASIGTDGTVVGNGAQPRITDGTPFTGGFSYLIGARTNNEPANGNPAVTLSRTIVVPATSPNKEAPSIGPSAVKLRGEMSVVAMSKADIDAMVGIYAAAAAAAAASAVARSLTQNAVPLVPRLAVTMPGYRSIAVNAAFSRM